VAHRNWTRDELLACFNLYCRIPFGKMDSRNPEVIGAASSLDRTPGAVAMKLVNFASLDPVQQARKIKGLKNASRQDRAIWNEFEANSTKVAEESEIAFDRLISRRELGVAEIQIPSGPTEAVSSRRLRLVQGFFRRTVLSSYGYRCSFCRLPVRALLTASHIIPWNASVELRADPRNGLCLCSLHDRAFDRGLMGIDSSFCLLVSPKLKHRNPLPIHKIGLLDLEGSRIQLPQRFAPNPACLEYHRNSVFQPGS
jgi:putative restriction endonuclease